MAARCRRIDLRLGTFESFEPAKRFHKFVTDELFRTWRSVRGKAALSTLPPHPARLHELGEGGLIVAVPA